MLFMQEPKAQTAGGKSPGAAAPGADPLPFKRKENKPGDKAVAAPFTTGAVDLAANALRGAKPNVRRGLLTRIATLRFPNILALGAGLSILLLAPLIEFFINPPMTASLSPGFNSQDGSFLEAGKPYEEGVGMLASGGLLGQGRRAVTPNAYGDPLKLISGPRAEEKIDAKAAEAKPSAPAFKPKTNWSNAIAAVKQSVKGAVEKASVPRPSAKLAAALSSIKSFAGGAGSQSSGGGGALLAKLERPDSRNLTGTPRGGSSLSRVEATRDFRDVASGGTGGALRAAGAASGTYDGSGSRGGSGGGGGDGGTFLRDGFASASSLAGGSIFSGGTPSGAGELKGFDPNKQEQKQVDQKESLAEMAKKLNMTKKIEHKWAKKKSLEIDRPAKREELMIQGAFQLAGQALQALATVLSKGGGGGEGGGGGGGGAQGAADAGTDSGNSAKKKDDNNNDEDTTIANNGNADRTTNPGAPNAGK